MSSAPGRVDDLAQVHMREVNLDAAATCVALRPARRPDNNKIGPLKLKQSKIETASQSASKAEDAVCHSARGRMIFDRLREMRAPKCRSNGSAPKVNSLICRLKFGSPPFKGGGLLLLDRLGGTRKFSIAATSKPVDRMGRPIGAD